MTLRKTIAANVRSMRLENGWTLEELGKRCKLNVQYISRLEKTQEVNVTSDNLEKLAKGLGVKVCELVEATKVTPPPSATAMKKLEQAMQLLESYHSLVAKE